MENSKIAAAILAVGATAAGLTFYISHQQSQSSSDPVPLSQSTSSQSSPENAQSSVSSNPTPRTSSSAPPSPSAAASVTPPNGIDQDTWDRAIRNTKMIYGMAQQARESGWMERMIEGRVKGDAKMISDQLGLDESTATKIETMLLDRANGSLEQTRKVWDAMLADEAKFTEMAAIRDMKEREVELSPELAARDQALRQEVFGQFAEDGKPLSDEDIQNLFRPQRPENWYEDDAFLVKAVAEMPEEQGSSMMEYAGKLDYLDRERNASRTVNNILRSTELSDQQSEQLQKLYIDSPEPSDEQLSEILPASQLEEVKKAANSRRFRGWGR
ncbi:hypothetical protein Rhal01_03188 [Rubritalea halochordaticola]|uniref:Uncharacterized protein n=1 Tax=Rubritalea halochordaticola TaxID=714537 RepID=A0ABP9V4T8_9BACT